MTWCVCVWCVRMCVHVVASKVQILLMAMVTVLFPIGHVDCWV